jgi:hypothetical protein
MASIIALERDDLSATASHHDVADAAFGVGNHFDAGFVEIG